MLPRPPRPRVLALLCLCAPLAGAVYWLYSLMGSVPPHHRYNAALHYAPSFTHCLINPLLRPSSVGDLPTPTLFDGLLAAPSLASWHLSTSSTLAPKLLSLHIFSTSSPGSRTRRSLIRHHTPVGFVHPDFKEMVEIKFIMGYPAADRRLDADVVAEEERIEEEMKRYGDMVRLEGLAGGENMNQGKSWEWIRWAGKREQETMWSLKCDDDVSGASGASGTSCSVSVLREAA